MFQSRNGRHQPRGACCVTLTHHKLMKHVRIPPPVMLRRAFIAGVAGFLAAPLAAKTQQATKAHRLSRRPLSRDGAFAADGSPDGRDFH
jgi:hypothetical protein